jgi:hypothetical protein
MKTQIIALEAHDDFISVRDRMSWAKSPRILLVWPKFEKITLRAADLRILQQHASYLGAQMGVITRRGDVRRDAERFGIPVFGSAAAAQRQVWPRRRPASPALSRTSRMTRADLASMREAARPMEAGWRLRPATRIGFFAMAVLAVLAIAALFLPQATIRPSPESQVQDILLPVTASPAIKTVSIAGSLPAHQITVTMSGTQSARVATESSIPDEPARGIIRFTNLSQSDLAIPAGTIVYSLSPTAVQFATLNDTHLAGNVNAVVEVPVVAVKGGAEANLPANAIQAIQGNLSLSAAVTNPKPTTGGTDRVTAAPSEADRQRLYAVLLDQLKAQAQSHVRDSIGSDDWLLDGTLKVSTVNEQTYDPPPGKPGNLLKLTLQAEFSAQYLKAGDLQQLVDATLDSSKPQGFLPVAETTSAVLTGTPRANAAGASSFQIHISRKVVRDINLMHASAIVRGKSPAAASRLLQAELPLASAPEIKLSPPWWPWLPLVPFRVVVVATQ